jgi:hypothetical protein
VHTRNKNPCYSGGRDGIKAGHKQKVSETPSQPIDAVCGGACLSSHIHGGCKAGGSQSKSAAQKHETVFEK